MSKGLEALSELYARASVYIKLNIENDLEHCLELYDTIEKELKDYEYLNSFFQMLKSKYEIDDLDYLEHICRNHERLVKKERALEIIKDNTRVLQNECILILIRKYKISKDEMDLLKEVLL